MPIQCRPTPFVLVAILALAALSTPSQAQAPETTLARENERLAAQVRDLEATLKSALARIAELETSLANAVSGQPTAASAATAAGTIEASNVSPAGLAMAIQADFKVDFEASGLPDPTNATNADERIRYTRWLDKWVAASNRQFRERVSWPVMVMGGKVVSTNNTLVTFQPWDVEKSIPVGGSFELAIPTRALARATRVRDGATDDHIALLGGIFIPEIRFNSERLEVGPFNNPPFIGSMAELVWRFEFQSLAPEATTAKASPNDPSGTEP
ncbi:MAG: hypothetical protein O3A19_12930 [Planctomycetota bacterium]|nr:hypothetical protein [Planctomycetota bacterium]